MMGKSKMVNQGGMAQVKVAVSDAKVRIAKHHGSKSEVARQAQTKMPMDDDGDMD
jgi:hypothetical protein